MRKNMILSFSLIGFLIVGCSKSSTLPEQISLSMPETYSITFTTNGDDRYFVICNDDTLYIDYEKYEGEYTDDEDFELFVTQGSEDSYEVYRYLGAVLSTTDANGWYHYTNEGERTTQHFFAFRYLSELGGGLSSLNAVLLDQNINPEETEYLLRSALRYTVERDGYDEHYILDQETNIPFLIEDNSMNENEFIPLMNVLAFTTSSEEIQYPHALPEAMNS